DVCGGAPPAAADHAIARGLPSASILSLIAKHRIGVALEALAHHHAAPGMLRSLLRAVLPMGRRSQQQRHACERGTDALPDGHCASLQVLLAESHSIDSIGSTPDAHGRYAPLNLRAWPSLAPGIPIHQTAPTETLETGPPSTRPGR